MTDTDASNAVTLAALLGEVRTLRAEVDAIRDTLSPVPAVDSPAARRERAAERAALDAHLAAEAARHAAEDEARRRAAVERSLDVLATAEGEPHVLALPPAERPWAVLSHVETAMPAGGDPFAWRNGGKQLDGCCSACCQTSFHSHSGSVFPRPGEAEHKLARLRARKEVGI